MRMGVGKAVAGNVSTGVGEGVLVVIISGASGPRIVTRWASKLSGGSVRAAISTRRPEVKGVVTWVLLSS